MRAPLHVLLAMLVAQLAVHADSSSSAPAPATAAPSPAPAPAPAAAVPSAPELQAQLDAAIRSHAATFTIPPGAYNFSTSNLNITGASALRLVATGVTAWFGGTAGVNISNSNSLHISGLSVNYTNPPHGRLGVPGITYNLLNCSDVISEDITIYKAPFFSVTAFNGGGGHTFRRFHLPNDTATNAKGRPSDPYPHQRDAFHFTDLRRGVVVEDSHASGFGDDFFNSHNTIMLVLKRESPTTLLIINPHLQNVKKGENGIISNKNTVYGTNCVLENLRAGDSVHFFGCPACLSSNGPGKNTNCTEEDFLIPPLGSDDSFIAGNPEEVTDAAVLADAAALAHNLTKFTNFDASDVWRVKFTAALPDSVGRAALVNIDAFSTPGTVIQNNNFSYTKYNLGRFKSSGGMIVNNSFTHANSQNLEISPLLQFFEGPLPRVRDVIISGNVFTGEGANPIHCSTMCGRDLPRLNGTALCPDCEHSAFAENISIFDNRIVP